jgi:hypothetical protein
MTTTTTSTFQAPVYEQPARPIFTRISMKEKVYFIIYLIIFLADSKFDFKHDSGDEDILYQWRLRRRLEQAQNGEPIIFPSKVIIIQF